MNLIQRTIARLARIDGEARGNRPLAEMQIRGGGGEGFTTARLVEYIAAISGGGGPFANRRNMGQNYSNSIPVFAGIRLRANAVARARAKVYIKKSNDYDVQENTLEWVGEDHPVQVLLDRMNPWWTRNRMWRAVETNLCIWGSAYKWINKVDPGDVSTWELWSLRPDRIAVVPDREDYIKGFIHDPHGARTAILPDEMIWHRYYHPMEEYQGHSPLAAGIATIDMHREMIDTNRSLFKNGVLASNWAFFLPGPLSDERIEEFQARIAQRYSEPANAGRPMVVDTGVGDVKNMGFSNKDMEFLEGLQFSKEMMLTLLGLEEEMMPGSKHSTFSNRREANQHFYQNVITQEWDMLESEMQEQFISKLPPPHNELIFRFDKSTIEALSTSRIDRVQELIRLMARGVVTINEVATELGFMLKEWGDVWWAPTNVMPVDSPEIPEAAQGPKTDPGGFGEDKDDAKKDDNGEGDDGEDNERPDNDTYEIGVRPVGRSWREAAEPPADYIPEYALYRKMIRDANLTRRGSALDNAWESLMNHIEIFASELQDRQNEILADLREEVESLMVRGVGVSRKDVLSGSVDYDEMLETERWVGDASDRMVEMAARMIESLGTEFIRSHDLGVEFRDERSSDRAGEVSVEWVRDLVYGVRDIVSSEINNSILDKDSSETSVERVGSVFDLFQALSEFIGPRPRIRGLATWAHIEACRQAGVSKKEWVSSRHIHDKCHSEMNGKSIGITEKFLLNNEWVDGPGGDDCRCMLAPAARPM